MSDRPRDSLPTCTTAISASVYLFLVYFGLGMTFSPFVELVMHRCCNHHGLEIADCVSTKDGAKVPGYDDAQRDASSFMIRFGLVNGLSQVATCAFYGALGDAYGRKFPLALPVVGGILGALTIGLMPASRGNDLFIFLIGLCSLLGGNYVTNHAAFAALADATQHLSAKQRSRVFALVEGANWGGLLIGPALGGFIADTIGCRHAFLVIAALGCGNLLLTMFTFRETLEKERRRAFDWSRVNPCTAILMLFHNRTTVLLAAVMFGAMMAQNGGGAVLSLYAIRVASLSPTSLGLLLTVLLGSGCIGLCAIMDLLTRFFTLPKVLMISTLNQVVAWVLMALCCVEWQLFVVVGSLFAQGLFFPVVRTGIVNTFGSQRYGEALAAVGTLEQLVSWLAAPALQTIYRSTEDATYTLGGVRVYCITFLAAAAFALFGSTSAFLLPEIPGNTACGKTRLLDS